MNTAEENNLTVWLRSKSRINYFVRHFVEIYLTRMNLDILRFVFYKTPENKLISHIKTIEDISSNLPYHPSSIKEGIRTLKKLNLLQKIKTNNQCAYCVNPFYIVSNPYNANEHIFNYYQLVHPELFETDEIEDNKDISQFLYLETFQSITNSFMENEKLYLLNKYDDEENIPEYYFKNKNCILYTNFNKKQMFDDDEINIIHFKNELRNKIFEGVNQILKYQIDVWIKQKYLVPIDSTKFKVNTTSNKAKRIKSCN